MIPLRVTDPENGTATTRVFVSEFLGPRGSLDVLEDRVDERVLTVGFERAASVEEVIGINSSEDVLAEITRCLTAHAFWWYDAAGRRHVAIAIDLTEPPRLAPGRYTFGSRSIAVRSPTGRSLEGMGWWAIEVSADGTAKMVHDRSVVSVYGAVTEDELVESDGWKLSIWSDPRFCLRDFAATQAVEGGLRWMVRWEREPRGR